MISSDKLEGLILAAGSSSRFNFNNSRFKKYFLAFNNSNILGYIITGMIKTGITKIKLVTSRIINKLKYRRRIIRTVTRFPIDLENLELDIIENKTPRRENGYSLFLGLNKITSEYTILSMADHIFSKNIFSNIIKVYKKKDILLATDPMHNEGYYDKDDATKVLGKNKYILKIGKDLTKYNRLDMGVFLLRTKTIKMICKQVESSFNKFGITDIILSSLNSGLDVGYHDFSRTIWLDVDNYKIYNQLKRLFNNSSNIYPFGLAPIG
ncbi:MAG: NTP transferase domain-containing protein [Candidatus Thorarchaeota archaeon]